MTITWYGQTCFRLQSPHFNLLIDPICSDSGKRSSFCGARIVVASRSLKQFPSGDVFLIDGPGEYERENVIVVGIAPTGLDEKNTKESVPPTLYILEVDGIRIAHINLETEKSLSDRDIESLGEIDIVMLPIGGRSSNAPPAKRAKRAHTSFSGDRQFLDGAAAGRIARAIDPKIVIPMGYDKGTKTKIDRVSLFLKAMGVGKITPFPKLVVKKKDLSTDEMKVVVLKPA